MYKRALLILYRGLFTLMLLAYKLMISSNNEIEIEQWLLVHYMPHCDVRINRLVKTSSMAFLAERYFQ